MLDSDLAILYGVETEYLTRQVRRNIKMFPEDFMFWHRRVFYPERVDLPIPFKEGSYTFLCSKKLFFSVSRNIKSFGESKMFEKQLFEEMLLNGAPRMRNTRKAVFQISYPIKDYYNNNGSSTKL